MGKRAKTTATPVAVNSPEVKPGPAESTPAASEQTQKAFTLERVKDGWSFVTLTFKDDKVLRVERSEPDMKAFAIEAFKIASFKYWGSIG